MLYMYVIYPCLTFKRDIPLELVIKANKLMKSGKAVGTSLIVAVMLNARGVLGAQLIRDLIEDSIHFWKIPTEWDMSIIVSLHKGKGVALERGNYRGFKLLDQVMNVLEMLAENLASYLNAAPQTTFSVRQLQEKLYTVNKTLYMAFVDLERL